MDWFLLEPCGTVPGLPGVSDRTELGGLLSVHYQTHLFLDALDVNHFIYEVK